MTVMLTGVVVIIGLMYRASPETPYGILWERLPIDGTCPESLALHYRPG
jgi:hypothetical protein